MRHIAAACDASLRHATKRCCMRLVSFSKDPHSSFALLSVLAIAPTLTYFSFRPRQHAPTKDEPTPSHDVSQRSLDADAPGPSRRCPEAPRKKPKQELVEDDRLSPVITELDFPKDPLAAAPGNHRTVDGFSYSFVAKQPTGLDMYRCVREETCSALMFVHPETGEIRFENQHSHDVNAVRFQYVVDARGMMVPSGIRGMAADA